MPGFPGTHRNAKLAQQVQSGDDARTISGKLQRWQQNSLRLYLADLAQFSAVIVMVSMMVTAPVVMIRHGGRGWRAAIWHPPTQRFYPRRAGRIFARNEHVHSVLVSRKWRAARFESAP
jgi:hypothetical protein